MLQLHGIVLLLTFFLNYLNHIGEEWIGNTFDKHGDCLGIHTLEVTCAVIRHVTIFLNGIHDFLFGFRIDIRVIIDRTGYSTDADSTYFSNILYSRFKHDFHLLVIFSSL